MLGYVCCLSFISPHLRQATTHKGCVALWSTRELKRSEYPATAAYTPVSLDGLANAASVFIRTVPKFGLLKSKSLMSSTTQTSTYRLDWMPQRNLGWVVTFLI